MRGLYQRLQPVPVCGMFYGKYPSVVRGHGPTMPYRAHARGEAPVDQA